MAESKTKSKTRSQANTTAAVVSADELYSFSELCQRLRWGRPTRRQAIRDGLPIITYGGRQYVRGADVLAFFSGMADSACTTPDDRR